MANLDSHLNNMADAVTNEKAVHEKLVNNNASLTATTTNQYDDIKKFIRKVKSLRKNSSYSSVNTAQTTKLLQAAIRFKWTPGGF